MKLKFFLLITAIVAAATVLASPPVEEGKSIFATRCAACHNVNKTLTGPALAGVDERRSLEWIVNFVHSSQTMIKNGDKDAVALYKQFNNIPMPDHTDLTEDQIKNVVEYIKTESKPATEEKAPFAKPYKLRPNYTPLSIKNYGFFAGYMAIVALLVVVLLFAVHVKEIERKGVRQY
ncbi:MAG TPA: cytochrome c [Chitinophagaceae bacterium]|nr:cytochrome c [Chitinophagaceae bacterium]